MTADSLLMEPQQVYAIRPPETSPIKSILFAVHDDHALDARLQAALALARACSAHLQLLHVIPVEAFTVADSYGTTFVSGEIVEVLQGQANKVRKRLEQHLAKEDVSWSYEVTTSALLAELIQQSALADLLVVGREPHWHEFNRTGPGLLGALMCSTRTPVCIPGDGCTSFDPFGKALIAWNGSNEAANAVRSAIGLLKMATDVRIARYTEDKDLSLKDERLLEYLSRHGVHAELETHLVKVSIGDDLIDRATRLGAEYVVMGGYSHSRAGEYLFGGVTRSLLNECKLSLIMAH